ncbi:hypothetical protein E2C01_037683 [Portunus trituberculatus]|uniref:Uncharacterized protein n=1 Tax=Portunus trituberculatus TaxID=210409 RepID=A0A5B7FHP5_PORTR|nr:hypothetical protein [Portunus trituberculatus]
MVVPIGDTSRLSLGQVLLQQTTLSFRRGHGNNGTPKENLSPTSTTTTTTSLHKISVHLTGRPHLTEV